MSKKGEQKEARWPNEGSEGGEGGGFPEKKELRRNRGLWGRSTVPIEPGDAEQIMQTGAKKKTKQGVRNV